MSDKAKRYRAFISYSQKDKSFARRLHRMLEAYRLPSGVEVEGVNAMTRKLGRFFRDDEEMGAATDLGAALQGAIADAESLIVVCSPSAAQSRWVNEEVIHFKCTGRADRIFAVIVGGEPNASAERRSQECFPPALRFEIGADGGLTNQPAEPLGLDIRREPFNKIIARLAAGLIRMPFDALWKREQRRARGRLAAVSLAFGLAVFILGGAVMQNLWRPKVDAYWRYERFTRSNVELLATSAGTSFQDCRAGSNDCPIMVVIPEGSFLMGTSNAGRYSDEGPQHAVNVGRFAASRFEITFGNWNACVTSGGCGGYAPDRFGWQGENRPVINVSWSDAQGYVQWLSYVTGVEYRLLSEAEWEYAARAGSTSDYSWGESPPSCERDAANGASFEFCGQSTQDVGTFRANAFGLYDMHGNVTEWVDDCYEDYDPEVRQRLQGMLGDSVASSGDCGYQVVRGGSWTDDAFRLRSASRDIGVRTARMVNRGFRVAKDCRKFRVSAGMMREGVSHAQTQSPLDPGRDFGPVVGRRGRQDSL